MNNYITLIIKAIDTINAVLQPKSTTSLLGQQSKPSATIRAEVRSIIPHGDQLTELVIVAREHGGPKHGILPATQLYNEIMQQDRINQLKQSLNCEKVVPHVEVDLKFISEPCKKSLV
jgi:hypothetical protein